MYKDITINVSVSEFCNLGCSHCFLGDERYNKNTIDFDVLNGLFRKLDIEFNDIQINWGGGDISLLPEDVWERITDSYSFKSEKFYNKLYSMLLERSDKFREFVEKFDEVQVSIDKYRKKNLFEDKSYIDRVKSYNIKKSISYTPNKSDDREFLEYCFDVAKRIDAKIFHLGVLYTSNYEEIVPAQKMIELLDIAIELAEVYDITLGVFEGLDGYSSDNIGWNAFSCFNNGAYVKSNGEITSCTILQKLTDIKVPTGDIRSLKEFDYLKFKGVNKGFIEDMFLKPSSECLECDYYPLCKGGCPFFRYLGSGKDIYCSFYKKLISETLKRLKDNKEKTI